MMFTAGFRKAVPPGRSGISALMCEKHIDDTHQPPLAE
jgi:hypothetical protein